MPNVFGDSRDAYVFGGAITAGAAVTWFRDQFCRDEAAAARERGTRRARPARRRARATCPQGAEGVLFLPYLMGERSPIWDGKASGAFVGLTLYHRREHLYRAVLEGVAFALRHNIEAGAAARVDARRRRLDRRRRRRAFRLVDADHRRRHRPAGADDRAGCRSRDGRRAARRLRRRAGKRRRRASRLGDARAARDAAAARGNCLRPAVRVIQGTLSRAQVDDARSRRAACDARSESPFSA